MKRIFLILYLNIIFITSTFAQWDILNQGLDGFPQDVDFIGNYGWISAYSFLYKTDDAGANWYSIDTDENVTIEKVDFITPLLGWAYGYSKLSLKYVILFSDDGGSSWSIKHELEAGYARDIYAINKDIVFVLGNSYVLKTVDGFDSWSSTSPEREQIEFQSFDFYNNKGAALGATYGLENQGMLFLTTDKGVRWEEIIEPDLRNIYDVKIVDDSIAFFSAENDSGETLLCKTTDFFKTWSIQTKKENFTNYKFNTLSEDTIFSATLTYGENAVTQNIEVSYNSGVDWILVKQLPLWGVSFIEFIDQIGFIVGTVGGGSVIGEPYGPLVLKSVDSGNSWDISQFSYPFLDVYFINQSRGFAAGGSDDIHFQAGEVFVTNDGGEHWAISQFPGSIVPAIQFIDDDNGYYLEGRSGKVHKTIDGGENWFPIYESNSDSIYLTSHDLEFLNINEGWMVGRYWTDENYAFVMHTIDGGADWEIEWQIEDSDLKDIHLIDAQNGWAVGNNGLVVRLRDGKWEKMANLNSLFLNKVFFIDKNNGWISTGYENPWYGSSNLFKTTNGGEEWQKIEDFDYIIDDIFFIDNRQGWLVGGDSLTQGALIYTKDGGENWDVLIDNLPGALHSIHFKDGHGWAVGSKGLVLRSDDGVNWIEDPPIKTKTFKLFQNYPNPFNAKTVISYKLKVKSEVDVSIFNLLGQKVATLVNKLQPAGTYSVIFDASDFASGVYYYQLMTGDGSTETKKLLLLK